MQCFYFLHVVENVHHECRLSLYVEDIGVIVYFNENFFVTSLNPCFFTIGSAVMGSAVMRSLAQCPGVYNRGGSLRHRCILFRSLLKEGEDE